MKYIAVLVLVLFDVLPYFRLYNQYILNEFGCEHLSGTNLQVRAVRKINVSNCLRSAMSNLTDQVDRKKEHFRTQFLEFL